MLDKIRHILTIFKMSFQQQQQEMVAIELDQQQHQEFVDAKSCPQCEQNGQPEDEDLDYDYLIPFWLFMCAILLTMAFLYIII
jgi:hypothetical protein